RPSSLRFALVCLVFVNMFIYAGINIYQAFLLQSSMPFDGARQGDKRVIVSVRQGFEGEFQVGDELVSINGTEANLALARRNDLRFDKPGERRTVIVRRNEQLREVETVSVSLPLRSQLFRILNYILLQTYFSSRDYCFSCSSRMINKHCCWH
ncbi:MAG: PDZ domain-containing protein, partial [Acidobacteria bacterium]|nr:PDZ domain-containing protein [Acidobacteriota bacterium]MCA1639743.1 PDZ domain-containing protein [Acidobacteriota bacterium]